jgi:hypothetical protein
VDNIAPSVGSLSDSPSTFYPREDDAFTEYRDTTLLSARGLNESATSRLQVLRHGASQPFRNLSLGIVSAGQTMRDRWNGRTGAGSLLAAGTYDYRFVLRDRAGNQRTTSRGSVNLSHKHLVRRTRLVTKNGVNYASASEYNACGMDISNVLSDWANGLWLNYCGYYYDDVSVVEYSFTTPGAAYYRSFQPVVYGYSGIEGNRLPVIIRDWGTADWASTGSAGPSLATHYLSTKYGPRWRNSARHVRLAVGFAGSGNDEYDIKWIGVRAVYGALVN